MNRRIHYTLQNIKVDQVLSGCKICMKNATVTKVSKPGIEK